MMQRTHWIKAPSFDDSPSIDVYQTVLESLQFMNFEAIPVRFDIIYILPIQHSPATQNNVPAPIGI